MPEMLLVNPRPRRRSRKKTTRKRRRRPAARRKVSRRRRNPSPPGTRRKLIRRRYKRNPALTARSIQGLAQSAATGAAGAIALDVALAYIPLPAMLKGGIAGKITKGVGAILLGVAAHRTKLVKYATARDMSVGALTVQFTGIGRDLLAQFAPGVALSAYMDNDYNGMGFYGSGWNPSRPLSWGGNASPGFNQGAALSAYMDSGYPIEAPGDMQPGLSAYEGDAAFGW